MQKLPFCSAEKLHEIASVYPTPFHLYDEKGIRETARRVQAAFPGMPASASTSPSRPIPIPIYSPCSKARGAAWIAPPSRS